MWVTGQLDDDTQRIENFDLDIEALQNANVAGAAVSAIDAGTWQGHHSHEADT